MKFTAVRPVIPCPRSATRHTAEGKWDESRFPWCYRRSEGFSPGPAQKDDKLRFQAGGDFGTLPTAPERLVMQAVRTRGRSLAGAMASRWPVAPAGTDTTVIHQIAGNSRYKKRLPASSAPHVSLQVFEKAWLDSARLQLRDEEIDLVEPALDSVFRGL